MGNGGAQIGLASPPRVIGRSGGSIKKAKAGDVSVSSQDTFNSFYKNHSRIFWRYILKMCGGDDQMADDVFQESFYKFIRSEPFHMTESQQKSYLYKIATNQIIDMFRRSKTESRYQSELLMEGKGDYDRMLSLDMDKLFTLLKPIERTLLWLAHVEHYSHEEIARITGKSKGGIKVQLFRIRKKFGDILKQKGYNMEVTA